MDPGVIANSRGGTAHVRRGASRTTHASGEIEEAIKQLQSMTDGCRIVFFRIGLLYALQGLSRGEVESALREVAGSDGRLLGKIPGVIGSLVRYGRVQS
jgi:hypothetical protein